MIYLIRHALDDENYVGSWSDASILDSEKEKVKEQAKFIKKNLNITNIYSSDIKRALETAEIIAKELNLSVKEDQNLREQNKGTLTGKLKTKLSKEESDLLRKQHIDTVFPEGESLQNLFDRVKDYIEIMNYEDDSLIVTHRGVINVFYYLFNDIPLDMDKNKFKVKHLSIHEVDIKNKTIRRIK